MVRIFFPVYCQVTAGEIDEFLTLMAVCHTVIPERTSGSSLVYQASSPGKYPLPSYIQPHHEVKLMCKIKRAR